MSSKERAREIQFSSCYCSPTLTCQPHEEIAAALDASEQRGARSCDHVKTQIEDLERRVQDLEAAQRVRPA